jgi:hypothetical protein
LHKLIIYYIVKKFNPNIERKNMYALSPKSKRAARELDKAGQNLLKDALKGANGESPESWSAVEFVSERAAVVEVGRHHQPVAICFGRIGPNDIDDADAVKDNRKKFDTYVTWDLRLELTSS